MDGTTDPVMAAGRAGYDRVDMTAAMEADHRIANSFQIAAALLNGAERGITDVAEAKLALRQAAARLLATARIHRTLCQSPQLGPIVMSDLLKSFRIDLQDSLGIAVEVQADGVTVPFHVAMDLGLIVSEMAINAAKHGVRDGRTPTLTFHARTSEAGRIRFRISDDGPGLPDGFDIHGSWGLGISIIVATVSGLGGTIKVVPAPNGGSGAGFEIALPAPGVGPASAQEKLTRCT